MKKNLSLLLVGCLIFSACGHSPIQNKSQPYVGPQSKSVSASVLTNNMLEIASGQTVELIYDTPIDATFFSPIEIKQSSLIYQENEHLYYLIRSDNTFQINRMNLKTQVVDALWQTNTEVITGFLILNNSELLLLCEVNPSSPEAQTGSDGPLPSRLFFCNTETKELTSINEKYDIPDNLGYNAVLANGTIIWENMCFFSNGDVQTLPENWRISFDSNVLYGYDTDSGTIFLLNENFDTTCPLFKASGIQHIVRGTKVYFFYTTDDKSVSKTVVFDLEEQAIVSHNEYHWPVPVSGFSTTILPRANGYEFLHNTYASNQGIRPEFSEIQLFTYDLHGNPTFKFPPFQQMGPTYGIEYAIYGATVYYLLENNADNATELLSAQATTAVE